MTKAGQWRAFPLQTPWVNLAGRKQAKTQRYHHHPVLPTLGALSRAIRAHVIQICVANDTVGHRSYAWYET